MTIKEYLDQTGKTVNGFAAEIGCRPEWLSYVSNGRRRPSMGFILKLIEVSGGEISVDGVMQPFKEEAA